MIGTHAQNAKAATQACTKLSNTSNKVRETQKNLPKSDVPDGLVCKIFLKVNSSENIENSELSKHFSGHEVLKLYF